QHCAVCLAGTDRDDAGILLERGGAADGQAAGRSALRPDWRDLRSRTAWVSERAAGVLPGDRAEHCEYLLLLWGDGMNRYHLVHITEFKYDGPVTESYNEVRLRPLTDDKQSCLSFRLTTKPASQSRSYQDAF